jgi:hypothetical protein
MIQKWLEHTSVHSIREFDENRMFFHDALNVLATDADYALVVLIGHVERDGSWHLLLNEGHTLLHRVICRCNNIDIKVVLSEAIEDDLDVA